MSKKLNVFKLLECYCMVRLSDSDEIGYTYCQKTPVEALTFKELKEGFNIQSMDQVGGSHTISMDLQSNSALLTEAFWKDNLFINTGDLGDFSSRFRKNRFVAVADPEKFQFEENLDKGVFVTVTPK